MTTITPTRIVDGVAVPAIGTWDIDKAHSKVEFVARHLMITKVRGSFEEYDGTIVVADDPAASSIDITLQAGSITTGSADRDGHLRSPDFLDVENFGTVRYRADRVERTGDGWLARGELTIKDVTRPVDLPFEFLGVTTDPWGNAKAGFEARTAIDREDFGLTWNVALESGGVLVSKKVTIEIGLQLHQG
ncbi:MAG TPA: YceI family protein [Acidimicrobiia bacterium]|nr:YceI family protein [Acidimicrobiia bacterium]